MIEQVTVAEGRAGPWAVRRITVTPEEEQMSALRYAIKGRGLVRAGVYTQLVHDRRGMS